MKNASTTVQATSGIPFFKLVLHTFLVMLAFMSTLNGQMVSVVNNTADDEFAHAYDFVLTPEDESTDGICEDSLHRCTLRAALEEASYLDVPARVTFSVGGVITLDDNNGSLSAPDDSWIQSFNQEVSIAGGGFFTPVIFIVGNRTLISGIEFTGALIGIIVEGNRNRIGLDHIGSANFINGMTQNGIIITGDSNEVTGNIIGSDIPGSRVGSPIGIAVFGNNNIIGGVRFGEGNLISGNDNGILVSPFDSSYVNLIAGNSIGTMIGGMAPLGNRVGIEVIGSNTLIGGSIPAAMNVISGNTESGVLTGLYAENIQIIGNHIGVDWSGIVSIPNRDGIVLGPGSKNCLVENNLIQENTQFGIFCSGLMGDTLLSSGHTIVGNDIFLNRIAGIGISNNAVNITVGESLTGAGSGNNIQYNGDGGVVFSSSFGTPKFNTIRKNDFRQNGIKAIDINTHCSICQEQTFPPDITSYTEVDAVTALVVGTHHDAGSVVDIYTGDINLSGHYEGRVWLGSATVDANHDFILSIDNCQCDIVATATDPNKNTSEFTDGEPLVTSIHDPQLNAINVFPNPSRDEVTFHFEVPQNVKATLTLYNATGQIVSTLFDDNFQEGVHAYTWKPGLESSGIYFYSLVYGSNNVIMGKVLLMK